MEGVFCGDDGEPFAFFAGHVLAVEPSELDQRFVGLSTAVAEEHTTGASFRDEPIGELLLAGDAVKVAAMDEGGGLFLNCAATHFGCECPTDVTAIPAPKSR